jgi:hypothetical protein
MMLGFRKKAKIITGDLTPCLNGEELLKQKAIDNYVTEIKQLLSCPLNVYESIYKIALVRLAEFCQALPYAQYADSGEYGFLERQLRLAIAALKLRRGKFFPKDANAETIAHDDGMWTYAIFSVAIMHGVYQIKNQVTVSLFNKNGESAGLWTPIAGSLYETGLLYKWHFGSIIDHVVEDKVTQGIILSKLAPISIFRWMHSNKEVFTTWFNAVINNRDEKNIINDLIDEAAEKAGITLISPTDPDASVDKNLADEVDKKLSNPFFNIKDIQ